MDIGCSKISSPLWTTCTNAATAIIASSEVGGLGCCRCASSTWPRAADYPLSPILVSWGCCKLCGFGTTVMYSLTVLDAKSPKSVSLDQNRGVGRAMSTLEALGKNVFLVSFSFSWLLALLDVWLHHSNLCLPNHTASFFLSVLKSPSASLKRTRY